MRERVPGRVSQGRGAAVSDKVAICEECEHAAHDAYCCEGMMNVTYRYGDAEAPCSCDIGKDD